MSQLQQIEADLRWKDLYKIGGIFMVVAAIMTTLAIVAYFIWPYLPGVHSTEEVFKAIQDNRLGGLMALDFFLLVGIPSVIPFFLALYVSLKSVNESYALIALVLGLFSVAALLPSRPIIEIMQLSDQYYATAPGNAAQSHYLAAGEALLALFGGTSWMASILFLYTSALIFSILMLRSVAYSKATAIVGIIINLCGLGFVIPVVGLILLMISTFGGIVWNLQLARSFLRLAKQAALLDE